MPKIKNHRRERMAQGLFRGKIAMTAYVAAGYLGDAHQNASKIANRPDVQARVRELNRAVVRTAIMDKTEALELATAIARASLLDWVRKTGRICKLDELAANATPHALKEITLRRTDANGDQIVAYKTHSSLEALALLAKMAGWEAPKTLDVNMNQGPLEDRSDEELAALEGGGDGGQG